MEFFTNVQRIGNRIWLRYTRDGKDFSTWVDDFCPTLYVKSNTKTEFQNIFETPLKPIKTDGVKHAREMIKQYEGVSGFELYGNPNWEYSYLFERFGNRCKYDTKHIHCAFIDIETSVGEFSEGFPYPNTAYERITLITVLYKGEYHVFSTGDFNCDKYNKIDLKIFKHVFDNEDDMLRDFMKFWSHRKPHAVTGWNIENFDIPYIINRVRQRLGDDEVKNLSPIRNVQLSFLEDDPKQVHRVSISGCEILDYLLMYKKYKPGERDFALDAMAEDFLGEKKVESPTGTESFRDFYTGDFDLALDFKPTNEVQTLALQRTILRKKVRDRTATDDEVKQFKELDSFIRRECWDCFVWYNIRDVDLVKRLDLKLGMLNLTYTISYLVGMNYGDVFGTVKPWDIFLQNENSKKGVFFSVADVKGVMPRQLMGGFVHLYKGGLYKDGVTLDATSLE